MSAINLFRAEWTKMAGHRWVTAFLVWIFPVGALAFVMVMALLLALVPDARSDEGASNLGLLEAQWTSRAISVWTFANSLLGRTVMLAFTSVVFAGEYQWQTWKNIVPRSRRVALILTKFAAVGAFIVVAFGLMSIILALGTWVLVAIVGGHYGPAISGSVVWQFVQDYAREAWLAFTLAVIAAAFAALIGMLTRSILGGVIVSVIVTYVEGVSVLGLALLAHLFDYQPIIYIYRLTPSYNVANVNSWIENGLSETQSGGLEILGDLINFSDDLGFSVMILMIWAVVLVAVTAYLFEIQDIT